MLVSFDFKFIRLDQKQRRKLVQRLGVFRFTCSLPQHYEDIPAASVQRPLRFKSVSLNTNAEMLA